MKMLTGDIMLIKTCLSSLSHTDFYTLTEFINSFEKCSKCSLSIYVLVFTFYE